MATIKISTPLRRLTNGEAEVEVSGSTLEDAITDLDGKYDGIKEKLLEGGEIQKFINIYVDNEDVRVGDGLGTTLKENSVISVLPAVSGG